jgi:hypothetical protein
VLSAFYSKKYHCNRSEDSGHFDVYRNWDGCGRRLREGLKYYNIHFVLLMSFIISGPLDLGLSYEEKVELRWDSHVSRVDSSTTMATKAYVIHSHYDPKDRERLEIETGQISGSSQTDPDQDDVNLEEAWVAESAAAFRSKRLSQLSAPRFVPASTSFSSDIKSSYPKVSSPSALKEDENDVATWYLSMCKPSSSKPPSASTTALVAEEGLRSSRGDTVKAERKTKNNWFIYNALPQAAPPPPLSTSTLADILARDPPPRSSERKFEPPVWLALGPSNKGFTMLEKTGWNEGEALGADVKRVRPSSQGGSRIEKRIDRETVSGEVIDMKMEYDGHEVRRVESIDLTASSDDDDLDVDENMAANEASREVQEPPDMYTNDDPYARKALVTPIATVLKSDRLGIGLKAKTVGPYKASQKRITHSAIAMAMHIRRSTKVQKFQAKHGKGRKGYAKQQKEQEEQRRAMISYLNS